MDRKLFGQMANSMDPVNSPIPGRESEMVMNDAGGFAFDDGPFGMLYRFVILGIDNGTFYVSPTTLSQRLMLAFKEYFREGSSEVPMDKRVERFMQLIHYGVKNGMRIRNVLSAYAIGTTMMPSEHRHIAYKPFNEIIRTGSDLLYFMSYVRSLGRGVGKGLRRAISRWYNSRDFEWVDYQMAKYTSRQGFHQRDVIRLAHPAPESDKLSAVFKYLVHGGEPPSFSRFYHIKRLEKVHDLDELMSIVDKHNLSWEMIPTDPWHGIPEFWIEMLNRLPWLAFLRHLRRYVNMWTLMRDRTGLNKAIERLNRMNVDAYHVHPGRIFDAYFALNAFAFTELTDALKGAFFRGFEKSDAKDISIGIGLDTSGSMFFHHEFDKAIAIAGILEKAFGRVEPVFFKSNAYVPKLTMPMSKLAFFGPFNAYSKERLRSLGILVGNTNAAASVEHFTNNGSKHDAIVILTDEQSWKGEHLSVAFKEYQKKVNPDAKLIVVSFSPGGRTLTDPKEKDQVTVTGWTPDIVDLVSNFVALG